MAQSSNSKAVEATSVSNPSSQASERSHNSPTPPADKQSQLATILIGLLIVASGLLIYNYFQASSAPETTTITDNNSQPSATVTPTEQPDQDGQDDQKAPDNNSSEGSYTVVAGDTLWSIAERVYGTGHKWQVIAESNTLAVDSNGRPVVEVGQTLSMPDSAASTTASKPSGSTATSSADSAGQPQSDSQLTSYTVVTGDTLWSISEQVYGQGQMWTRIFDDGSNRLGRLPDGTPLIHAGNVLRIPR